MIKKGTTKEIESDDDPKDLTLATSKQYFENWCEKVRDLTSYYEDSKDEEDEDSKFLITSSREENLKKFTDYPNDLMFDAYARIFNIKGEGGTTATAIRDGILHVAYNNKMPAQNQNTITNIMFALEQSIIDRSPTFFLTAALAANREFKEKLKSYSLEIHANPSRSNEDSYELKRFEGALNESATTIEGSPIVK